MVVSLEIAYRVADAPVRLGAVSLDLSITVLFVVVFIAMSAVHP